MFVGVCARRVLCVRGCVRVYRMCMSVGGCTPCVCCVVMCRGSVHVEGVGVCAHRVLCVGGCVCACVCVWGGARRVCVVCRGV